MKKCMIVLAGALFMCGCATGHYESLAKARLQAEGYVPSSWNNGVMINESMPQGHKSAQLSDVAADMYGWKYYLAWAWDYVLMPSLTAVGGTYAVQQAADALNNDDKNDDSPQVNTQGGDYYNLRNANNNTLIRDNSTQASE